MRKLLAAFSLVFLATPFISYSQDTGNEWGSLDFEKYFITSKHIGKIAPLKLLDPQTTLMLGYEYRPFTHVSFQVEAGVTPQFMQIRWWDGLYGQTLYNKINGFQVRFEPRFYVFKSGRAYTSAEFSYRYFKYNEENEYGFECDSTGNCVYFQRVDQDMVRHVWTVYFKFGRQRLYNKVVLDYFGGIGVRGQHVIELTPPPPGGTLDRWGINSLNEAGVSVIPSITVGLRLGLRLE